MTAPRFVLVLVLAALAAGLTLSCGKSDSDVVAEVGEEKITVRDFQDFLDRNPIGFRSAQEEFDGKRMLLDSLINHTLLVQAAYAKHIDQSPEVGRIMAANRARFVLDALYHARIDERISVSEAELRQIYDDLQYQVRAFHIMFDNPDTAQMVFDKLKAGASFEEMAYQYSIDQSARRNRGDLGYFVRGTHPEEFEKIIFRLEAGEITPPFQTSFGYHIIKLVDKKANAPREPYTSLRPALYEQVRQGKRREIGTAYVDSIGMAYKITVDTTVANYLMHKRSTLYPPQLLDKLTKSDFDDEQLDRDEKELVLATWDGGQISVIEYLMEVRRYFPPEYRPNFDDIDSLEAVISQLKRQDVLVHEAEKGGILEGEYFKRKFKTFERYTIAEIMRNDSILTPQPPSEQDMRDYYDQHREDYLVPARVRLFEILVSDQMLAQRLVREIKTLEQFQTRAVQHTERMAARVKGGDLGYCDSVNFPVHFAMARRTQIGTIAGPVPSGGRFVIIWPERWTPETYEDYLNVKEDISERLMTENKNRAVNEWLKQRRDDSDIEINDDAIWSMIDKEMYATAGSTTTTP